MSVALLDITEENGDMVKAYLPRRREKGKLILASEVANRNNANIIAITVQNNNPKLKQKGASDGALCERLIADSDRRTTIRSY